MSSQIINQPSLNQSLEVLSQLILSKKQTSLINGERIPCFKYYSGQCIGGLKRHHKFHVDNICKSVSNSNNFDIDSKNIGQVLFSLFIKVQPKEYGKYSYMLLSDIVKYNPSISESKNFSEDELDTLLKLKEKSDEICDIDDPFIIPETQNHSIQLNTTMDNLSSNKFSNLNDNQLTLDKTFLVDAIQKMKTDFEIEINRLREEITGNVNSEFYLASERLKVLKYKIKNLCNKKLRYENDLKVIKLHEEELKTVPAQLNFDKFPEPFLKHSLNFVNDYNNLIKKFQLEIMSLIKSHLNNELSVLEKDLKYYKHNLRNLTDNVDSFIENIHKQEENFLSNQFIDSDNKARRVEMRPYAVNAKDNLGRYNSNGHNFTKSNYNRQNFNNKFKFQNKSMNLNVSNQKDILNSRRNSESRSRSRSIKRKTSISQNDLNHESSLRNNSKSDDNFNGNFSHSNSHGKQIKNFNNKTNEKTENKTVNFRINRNYPKRK